MRKAAVAIGVTLLALLGLPTTTAHAATPGRFVAASYPAPDGRPLCITVLTYDNNSPLYSRPCIPNSPSQGWIAEWVGGVVRLHSAGNYYKCMDNLRIPTISVRIYDCDSTTSQLWNVAQLGGGLSMWGNVHDGTTCLSLDLRDLYGEILQRPCAPHYLYTIWKG